MSRQLLLKNRKSESETSFWVILIELFLATILVISLIYMSSKLSGFIFGRQEYDSVLNNLEALSLRVKELAKDKRDIVAQTMVYTISDNFILVGFSYEDKGVMRTECTNENIVNSRPTLCRAKSCLCIYKNHGVGVIDWSGNDFDLKGAVPLKCTSFEDKLVFFGPQSDENFKGAASSWAVSNGAWSNNNYLVLYGKCGSPLRQSWGLRQIKIEKHREVSNIFIKISEMKKT